MKILLVGYGKMGKAIEQVALSRKHEIVGRITDLNKQDLQAFNSQNADVAIEFSQPEAAFGNIKSCLANGIAVVSGTTGWLAQKPLIDEFCNAHLGAFLYASNFSVGVNLFFELNKYLAALMASFEQYEVCMEEIHHTEKKDAPSGTAITLAESIIKERASLTDWVNAPTEDATQLSIISKREANVAGTHSVSYTSSVDTLAITHTAHSREGFAWGAVIAAEWIRNKQGVFSMQDVLNLTKRA